MLVYLFILICAGISFLSNLLLIILLCSKKTLYKSYKGYLLALSCIQAVYNFHWATADAWLHEYVVNDLKLCLEYGIVNVTLYFLILNYATVISLFIYGKIKNWPDTRCKPRPFIYNISCITISASETAAIVFLGTFGESQLKTCAISESSPGEIIYLIPIALNFPIVFLTMLLIAFQSNAKPSMIPLKYALASLLLTMGVPTLVNLIIYFFNELRQIKLYMEPLQALSGCLFTLCIMLNKYVFHKLRASDSELTLYFQTGSNLEINRSLYNSLAEDSLGLHDMDILGNFLESGWKKNFLQILVLMTLRFSDSNDVIRRSMGLAKISRKYEEFMLRDLAMKYNIGHFIRCKKHLVDFSGLTLDEHYEAEFEELRKLHKWTHQDVFKSIIDWNNFTLVENINNSMPTSFMITADGKLRIRIIQISRIKSLGKQLLRYLEYMHSFPDCKLERILGVFTIEPTKIGFLLIENSTNQESLIDSYKIGSQILKQQQGSFAPIENTEKLQIEAASVVNIISRDLEFISSMRSIDYYLELNMHNKESDSNSYYFNNSRGDLLSIILRDFFIKPQSSFCLRNICRCRKISHNSSRFYKKRLLCHLDNLLKE